ncbi:MAG: hypothetical protein KJ063_22235 [Anaerolineae bacterium]|nr:hypothetical protein [Anaerolineae bacterium]
MNQTMPHPLINQLLAAVKAELNLSQETEQEILAELRDHLEDAWETAIANGEDGAQAMHKVARRFGGADVGQALQQVHGEWESAEAILACLVPVLAALALRWLLLVPDGAAANWQTVLVQPIFWLVALAVLLIPILQFQQWRYTLVNWGFFWVISLIFILAPTTAHW